MEIDSYSPSINKKIQIKSLKTLINKKINTCNNLLKINIGTKKEPNCLNYDNIKVQELLLNNLKASKHLNPELFIAPKQLMANCWFNTMFVSFFFSDKGRKFFRFFRELMIKGTKVNGEKIKDKKLRELFFVLNLFIEASYNQNEIINKKYFTLSNINRKNKTRKLSVKSKNLYEEIKDLTNNLYTNYFIKIIYERINNLTYKSIPNINDAGNPIYYYRSIIDYLNYNMLKLFEMDIENNINIKKKLEEKLYYYHVIPDLILLNDIESSTKYNSNYILNINNKKHKYKLDSIILTNKGFFKPKENKHFICVCTINKKGYKFDGDSYSRLSKFDWLPLLNVNKDWEFIENTSIYPEKYNFTKGYKILFYYRES